MDFDNNGRYEFAHCETCDGPLLGHIETKCASLDGVKYDGVLIKSIENWLKRIEGFREAVVRRNKKHKEEDIVQIRETVKTVI